jgi:alpha-glucoside transport system permease protein
LSSTAVPGPVGRPRGRQLPSFFARSGWQGFAFILPAIVCLGLFVVYPLVYTVILSFGDTNAKLQIVDWVGFDNFKTLFTDDKEFLDLESFPPTGAFVNNLKWVVLYTTLSLGLGLLIAVLAARVRYESMIKAIVFIPMAISATAVAIIWKFVYDPDPDPDIGSLNALITLFGGEAKAWYGREDLVNYALIWANFWASTGFAMVVLSAALRGISEEVIEAAGTDGASEWGIFRRIQLLLLSLPIAVVTVWLLIAVIKVFDIIYVMTGGGPGGSSEVIAFSMYDETFTNGEAGYGAAVAVVMLLLIIPIMAFNIRRFRSERVMN